jgi:hypothetical protein
VWLLGEGEDEAARRRDKARRKKDKKAQRYEHWGARCGVVVCGAEVSVCVVGWCSAAEEEAKKEAEREEILKGAVK